eukprot:2602779-Prymnesium_polylepis.1
MPRKAQEAPRQIALWANLLVARSWQALVHANNRIDDALVRKAFRPIEAQVLDSTLTAEGHLRIWEGKRWVWSSTSL